MNKDDFDKAIRDEADRIRKKLTESKDVDFEEILQQAAEHVKLLMNEEKHKRFEQAVDKIKSILIEIANDLNVDDTLIIVQGKKGNSGNDIINVRGMMQGQEEQLMEVLHHVLQRGQFDFEKFQALRKLGMLSDKSINAKFNEL